MTQSTVFQPVAEEMSSRGLQNFKERELFFCVIRKSFSVQALDMTYLVLRGDLLFYWVIKPRTASLSGRRVSICEALFSPERRKFMIV